MTPFIFSSAISTANIRILFPLARPSISFAIVNQAILPAVPCASVAVAASLWTRNVRDANTSTPRFPQKRLKVAQRISTSAIMAFCSARRSDSNSSGVVVGLIDAAD